MKNPYPKRYQDLSHDAIGVISDKIVAAPYAGEFGWLTSMALRQFDIHPAKEKIVCCPESHKVFYPNATGFHHDYNFNISGRKGQGGWHNRTLAVKIAQEFIDSNPKYSDYKVWYPKKGNCWNDGKMFRHEPKFTPKPQCDPVDVVFSYRKRKMASCKNTSPKLYKHTLRMLKNRGYTTGIVGAKSSSGETENIDYRAWDYDNEDDATVEMMQNAKLVIATNTGIAHLAILLGVPLMLVHSPLPQPAMVCFMEVSRNPNVFFHKLSKDEFMKCGRWYVRNYLDRFNSEG